MGDHRDTKTGPVGGPAFGEADACRMMSPDEVRWTEVSLETLHQLTAATELPPCDDETLGPGPAYWEYAIAELEQQEPAAAVEAARTWLDLNLGDGWSRAIAWRIIHSREPERAFAWIERKRGGVNLAVLAKAVEAHESELRLLADQDPGEQAPGAATVESRSWLVEIARTSRNGCSSANPFRAQLDQAIESLERYFAELRLRGP